MSILDALPPLRLRIQKYVVVGQSVGRGNGHLRHKSGPGKNEWTHKKILDLAGWHHMDQMKFLDHRYEELKTTTNRIARLSRLLDQIESGMMTLVNGEPVIAESTKRPDAVHRVAILLSGRPVLKIASKSPEPAKSLKNPFKRG